MTSRRSKACIAHGRFRGARRVVCRWILLAWVCAGPAVSSPDADAAGDPRPDATTALRTRRASPPNILWIISDDQAWTDYGFMGHPKIQTPRLDRLARESLCFTRGYVPASLCCPSLASMVTGRFPHEHGVVCNDPPRPKDVPVGEFYRSPAFRAGRDRLASLLERWPTLPGQLRTAGYRSFQAGKWWLESYRHGGFTDGMTVGDPTTGGRHGDVGLEIGRKTLAPIREFIDDATRSGTPWLVWYAPMMPHDPHTPPDRFLAKYRDQAPSLPVAKYWGMVEWFDATCGELLDDLDRRGLADDTVVVFLADNGWITDPVTGRYAPRSKQSPYDGGLRTPILLRWPGHIAARRCEIPVSSVDLMPTLLRIAGLELPAGLPGVDLLDARAVARRKDVFGACFTHDAVDLERPASGLRWRWVVEGDWKLVAPSPWNEPGARPELFRISDDPFELRDRSASNPRRARRLQKQLDRWWGPAGDSPAR